LIGRAKHARIRIEHPSISREHAALYMRDELELEDLQSANGTRWRGNQLEAGAIIKVAPNDVIELGEVMLVVKQRQLVQGQELQPSNAPSGSDGRTTVPGRKQELAPPSIHGKAPAGWIVEDDAMRRVRRLLERIAQSELSVILLGETGVGKEMCAELVHLCSARHEQTFLRLNCAALSETLLESELFGHERGAFTGATSDKIGLLEAASGGTVFLDEVGDMPLATQIKLLRVLESKEILRLGGRAPRRIDVRVVSATNQDLQERITSGLFREDLYYRLNGISVSVPPLRERRQDIEPLARHFVARQKSGQAKAMPELSEASIAWLHQQSWPGNVRELRNVIERALVLCDGPSIEPQHLDLQPAAREPRAKPANAPSDRALRDEVKELERERIEQALREAGGNQSRAAEKLGISRGALLRRLAQLGITRLRKDD
jgi:DNA-binding NtrC family response regulator